MIGPQNNTNRITKTIRHMLTRLSSAFRFNTLCTEEPSTHGRIKVSPCLVHSEPDNEYLVGNGCFTVQNPTWFRRRHILNVLERDIPRPSRLVSFGNFVGKTSPKHMTLEPWYSNPTQFHCSQPNVHYLVINTAMCFPCECWWQTFKGGVEEHANIYRKCVR